MNQYKGVRYQETEQVPVCTWAAQGTIYDDPNQAKFAAARLWSSCNNYGVVVKKISAGWTIYFWR